MKNIIIVGYPKSGCTWVTRLTAELLKCPVEGFWPNCRKEIGLEGRKRKSNYRCFKAHHQLKDLDLTKREGDSSIIYVIRDPRDIIVSGSKYFDFANKKYRNILLNIPYGLGIYRRTIGKITPSKNKKIDMIIQDILYGKSVVGYWHNVSWRNHYKPYLDAGVLFVKYEDMLERPKIECKRILEYLKVSREEKFIEKSIYNQSFEKKKKDLLKKGKFRKAMFLKSGKKAQWKTVFTDDQKEKLNNELEKDLEFFSYEV